MCLGIPGEIMAIHCDQPLQREGTVRFGGISKTINLSFVPDAMPGDFVIVHVGFAISRIDQAEAGRIFATLAELGDLEVLNRDPQP